MHCNQIAGATQMVISEMKVWQDEGWVDGMKRERGEEEIQVEEHLLISVMASVMIYQVQNSPIFGEIIVCL